MKHPQYAEKLEAQAQDRLASRYLLKFFILGLCGWLLVYAILYGYLLPDLNALTHLALFASGSVICISVCAMLARHRARRELPL